MEENKSTASSSDFDPELRIDDEDRECPICLEEINNKNVILTSCGHEFCKVCIYKWLDKPEGGKRKCPMCNHEISRDHLKSISKNNSKAGTAHSRRREQSKTHPAAARVIIQRRLPLNMHGFSSNSFKSKNGRLVINHVECQNGYYEQDGLNITIENGILTAFDQNGQKTCFGGNISGVFSWCFMDSFMNILIAANQVAPGNMLPLNMHEYARNSFKSQNGRIVINNIECQNGYYEQDEHKITIENGILCSIDKKGIKTCFGGNISGFFSWNRSMFFLINYINKKK